MLYVKPIKYNVMNKEIINNNKLIAIYMGGKTSDMNNKIVQGFQNIWLPIHGVCNWTSIDTGKGKILHYHNSWDWLIPVIDKIYSSNEYIEYKNTLGQFNDGIFINTKYINVTYNDVIDFIKWYNNK
jgi:hypothetical protein